MNEKQKKALDCLNGIEQYAKEQKLSTRILDGIDECKKQIAADDTKWIEVNLAVEDILKSIEQKTAPVSIYKDKDKNEISIQEIKAQVTKMAERCHTENETSVGMMAERKNAVLQKTYSEIQEIAYIKAHLKELKDENLYLEFYRKVKSIYENNVFQLIRGMLGDISNNYNYMLEHMKSMFQSIGGYVAGVSNKTFYYEYTERKEGLDKKIQSEIESLEVGSSEILSFGIRTKEAIKDIKKKINRKTKLLMMTPILIALSVLLVCFSVKTITLINENKAAIEKEEEKENSEAESDAEAKAESEETNAEIANDVMEVLETVVTSRIETELVSDMEKSAITIKVIFGIVVLYVIYILMLKLWCNHQIRKQCGAYLKTELIQFEQNNTLMPKLDEAMKTAVEEYESQYLAILNSIFSGTNYNMDNTQNEKQDQFTALKEEWSALRYE